MPIHKDGVIRQEKEKHFTVIYKIQTTVTDYIESSIWAEDWESLAENAYNDGHVQSGDMDYVSIGTIVSKKQLVSIKIGEEG